MRPFLIAAAAILLGGLAAAQTTGSPWQGTSLVAMVPGVPLIVEQVEERTTRLPGKSQMEIVESKIYRDSAGRFRIESKAPLPMSDLILLADPIEKSITLLVSSAKVAHQMKDDSATGLALAWSGIPLLGSNRKVEKIGKRVIEGLECEGERLTVTSDDNPNAITVDERWISKDLGLTLRAETTSPTQHYSAKIRSVIRKDPDPGFFLIPPDFTVRSIEDDGKEHPLE